MAGSVRTAVLAWALAAGLLCAQALPVFAAPAEVIRGEVTKVSDGDTFWLRPAECGAFARRCRPIKVRMLGIDAPERCQAWGPEAAQALRNRLLHQTVQVTSTSNDTYDRTLGEVRLGQDDVAAWMVREGHAWSYRHHRQPGPYAAEEAAARQSHRGLFQAPDAVEPQVFRRSHGPCANG